MYLVNDAMTAVPITVFPEDDLVRARQLMSTNRIRHLPVVQRGQLVGLLTERDLLRVTGGAPAERAEMTTVRDVMVSKVVTTTARMPLRKAARLLWEHKFGCLPVVDAELRVIGILTETDFIRFAADIATDFDRSEAEAVAVAKPEP